MSQPEATSSLPLVYGVWLTGKGWLRDGSRREFADMRIEYARDALKMSKTKGLIVMFDESMLALEPYFLENEAKQNQSRLGNRIIAFLRRILKKREVAA